MQFRIKIRNPNSQNYENGNVNNNNETRVSEAVIDESGTFLSDLFNKLHNLTVGRGISYTITECLLDQVSQTNQNPNQTTSTVICFPFSS